MILALWYHTILAVIFTVIAIALMGVILLQRGKGVGLAGAFGGAGGHTAFGAKTGDFLTWVTIVGAVLFLVWAVLMNFWFVPITPTAPPTPGGAPPRGGQGSSCAPIHESSQAQFAQVSIFGVDET